MSAQHIILSTVSTAGSASRRRTDLLPELTVTVTDSYSGFGTAGGPTSARFFAGRVWVARDRRLAAALAVGPARLDRRVERSIADPRSSGGTGRINVVFPRYKITNGVHSVLIRDHITKLDLDDDEP